MVFLLPKRRVELDQFVLAFQRHLIAAQHLSQQCHCDDNAEMSNCKLCVLKYLDIWVNTNSLPSCLPRYVSLTTTSSKRPRYAHNVFINKSWLCIQAIILVSHLPIRIHEWIYARRPTSHFRWSNSNVYPRSRSQSNRRSSSSLQNGLYNVPTIK